MNESETGAKAPAPEGDSAAFRPPLSTSAGALLDAGGEAAGDERFRAMVYDLLALEAQMREARDRLAAEMGVSGPGYMILMAVAQQQRDRGVSVSDVARRLHVTGAFVTTETGKLVRAGLLAKRRNPDDGRGVLLRLTPAGEARVEAMAPRVRRVNDHFFGGLTAREFDMLAGIAARLGRKSAAACFLAEEEAA